jgi:hypothetical protein
VASMAEQMRFPVPRSEFQVTGVHGELGPGNRELDIGASHV